MAASHRRIATRRTKLIGVLMIALPGCATAAPSALTHSVRTVPPERRDALWSAVLAVLPEQGFAIDRTDEAKGVVTSSPVEISAQEAGLAATGRLSTGRVFRRLAEVRVAPSEGGIGCYCRVPIQEQATESYRLFRRAPGASDIPDDTPIDRDAATTGEQNTVWQTVRRDKLREYRLLEEIVARTTTP